MPTVRIDREDLAQLLQGETICHPITGLRVAIDDEVIKEVPPSLVTDLVSYLKG